MEKRRRRRQHDSRHDHQLGFHVVAIVDAVVWRFCSYSFQFIVLFAVAVFLFVAVVFVVVVTP